MTLGAFRERMQAGGWVLCGAGVSRLAPTNAPLGDKLRDECVAALLSDRNSRRWLRSLMHTQAYRRLLPESLLQDVSSFASDELDSLMVGRLTGLRPNACHRALAGLFPVVFTTNFDVCFEQARALRVVHLHGSVLRPSRIQNRSFRLARTVPGAVWSFRRAIRDGRLFVLGYSARDQDVLEAIAEGRPREICFLSYAGQPPRALAGLAPVFRWARGSLESLLRVRARRERASSRPRIAPVVRLRAGQRCAALLNLASRTGHYEDAPRVLAWYRRRLDPHTRLKSTFIAVDCLRMAGRFEPSARLLAAALRESAIRLPREADSLSWAYVLRGLLAIEGPNQDARSALVDYRRGLRAIARFARTRRGRTAKEGIRVWRARILNNVGEACAAEGRYSDAVINFRRSLAIKRRLHDDRGTAQTLANLSLTEARAGRLHTAERHLAECLLILQRSPDRYVLADALSRHGDLLAEAAGVPSPGLASAGAGTAKWLVEIRRALPQGLRRHALTLARGAALLESLAARTTAF